MFSEFTLEEIRNRASIVDVVSEYVELKKSGTGFTGLCPFHKEKTPSFHVNPSVQIFKCFGCQKGGNVFSFYSAVEGLSFPEAVRKLAARFGVEIEESQPQRKPSQPRVSSSQERLLAANQWAAKYFHYLLTEVAEYAFAREYLKSRGVSEASMQAFKIGIAPKGWSKLLELLLKRGFSLHELISAGLVIEKKGSPTGGYDRFRERLMFPITDIEGRVVGFGGRIMVEDKKQPKYLNTPESPLFSKRHILYGLRENQRGIRLKGEALIVEGYMDVVGLYEHGVQNAVATMGTALTPQHCRHLKSLTRNVVTVFDADDAGADAWHRSVHLLMEAGIFAKDLSLPDKTDPDEFVQKVGSEEFYRLCSKAPRQVTKLLREIASKGGLSEQEVGETLESFTPLLVASRRLPDRALLWDDISLVLGVSTSALKEIAQNARRPTGEQAEEAPQPTKRGKVPKSTPPPHFDLAFLQGSLRNRNAFCNLAKEKWLEAIEEPSIREILLSLHAQTTQEGWEKQLKDAAGKETRDWMLEALSGALMGAPQPGEAEATFNALVEGAMKRMKEKEIQKLKQQVKLSQRLGDGEGSLKFLQRLRQLRSD